MSFSFGNTSTPTKPNTFGGSNTSFGGFGASTSAFGGTSAAAPPAFGAATNTATPSLFGQTATAPTTSAPAFGFGTATSTPAFGGFGGTATIPTTSAPAFGFSGGTATTSAPAFGFGTSTTNTFGTGTAGFSGGTATFGQNTFAKPSTGFSGFGAPGSTGFGAPASTGFGATAQTGFGTQPQTGFGAAAQTGFGGGQGFGGATGGFGTALGGTSGFGAFGQQQQQQQQQPTPLTPDERLLNSIFCLNLFGDERDQIMARWNHLQAVWGIGKAFDSQTQPPIEVDQQNPFCRLKAIGYSKISGKDNKLGLIALNFNKSLAQIKDQQAQIVQSVHQVLSKPNISVNVDSTKQISDQKAQMMIYIEEKSATNETKRVPATDVATFLNQPNPTQQLRNVGVEAVFAFVAPDDDQIKEYLDKPPKGIDPRMWEQAKQDNPDPKKFIPVPIIGFNGLKQRLKCQENETEGHSLYLSKVEREVADLRQRHNNTTAKVLEHRRKLVELSHRILKIIVKQESTRKMGVVLSPDEEVIRTKLENMHTIVSAPTQFKGKLNELLSQVRMQRNQWKSAGNANEYALDKDSSEEMKNFLTMQQRAMALLIETVNKDLKDLKVIQDGMGKILQP